MQTEIKRTANGFFLKQGGVVKVYTAPYKAMVYPLSGNVVGIQINGDHNYETLPLNDTKVNGTPFTGTQEELIDVIANTVFDISA